MLLSDAAALMQRLLAWLFADYEATATMQSPARQLCTPY
jgi:hypothetical protein